MIDETEIELKYNAAKGVVEGFDPRFKADWTFFGPDVGSKTKTVETLRDIELSEIKFSMKTDAGTIRLTLDGVEKNLDGSHPNLTLKLLLSSEFRDLAGGNDKYFGSKI
jgi:hypothetical protein